jgi:multidrug resistance protein, MATE family
LLSLDPTTQDKSRDYLQAVAFGMPAAALFQALRCHTQGIGVMRPFALASVIGFFANIPLNYAFIYGRLGAPEMGAAGCGLATAISMWLSPLLIAFYMRRATDLKPYLPPLKLAPPQPILILEIARLGLPVGATFFLEVAVFSVIALLIATLGNTAVAAHQIAVNVWDVVYMPLISLGSAMATRVGHAIGAGDRHALNLAFQCGLLLTLLVAAGCMVLLLLAPEPIVRAYTEDGDIRYLALALIRLAAFFIVIDALQVATSFCLRAFKEARYPFLVMCAAYWCLTLPLGYWLGMVRADSAFDGTRGFWQAMILGIVVAALLIGWRLWIVFRRPLPATPAVPSVVGQA